MWGTKAELPEDKKSAPMPGLVARATFTLSPTLGAPGSRPAFGR